MRISADRETCVGAGSCVLAEPAVFDQDDDDGRVVLHLVEPDASLAETVRDAVAACPVGALRVIED